MADLSLPHDIALWNLHCLSLGARSTPQHVARLDNNGELLFFAMGGSTLDALVDRGLEFTESQVGLLDRLRPDLPDEDRLETTFPVLGPEAVVWAYDGSIGRLRWGAEAEGSRSGRSSVRAARLMTFVLSR